MDLFIFICRFRFARQDLAWVYPVYRSKVNALYDY